MMSGWIHPALVALAWIAGLFFNGEILLAFATSQSLLALWLARNLSAVHHEGIRIGDPLLPAAAGLLLLWLLTATLFSRIPYLSWLNLFWMGVLPGSFLIAWLDPDRPRFLGRAFALLEIGGVVLALVACVQLLLLGDDPSGTFKTRNSLAALLVMIAFLLLADVLRTRGRLRLLPAIGLFLVWLAVGLIQSRGAWLGMAGGLSLFLLLAVSRQNLSAWRLPALVLISAMLLAWLLSLGHPVTGADLLSRAGTLGDVQSAGSTRFVIWEPAWRLFLQHPWLGTGPGTYFMVIPPWLDPADNSAHFYVHNDYLQLLVETGIPGLIALLLLFLASLRLVLAGARRIPRRQSSRFDLAAATAALSGVAIHSAFTFNLYILPTMLLAGLLLARLHALASQAETAPVFPLRSLRPGMLRLVQIVLVGVTMWHFGNLALAERALDEGRRLAAAGRLEPAHARFVRARRHAPAMDSPWFSDADLLQRSARLLPDRPDQARDLLTDALRDTEQAIARNPCRPQSHDIRARILAQLEPDSPEIERAWQEALRRDPRYLPARTGLAQWYLDRDRPTDALAILREGLRYRYPVNRDLDAYLALLERTARQAGDIALAERAAARREELSSRQGGKPHAP